MDKMIRVIREGIHFPHLRHATQQKHVGVYTENLPAWTIEMVPTCRRCPNGDTQK